MEHTRKGHNSGLQEWEECAERRSIVLWKHWRGIYTGEAQGLGTYIEWNSE